MSSESKTFFFEASDEISIVHFDPDPVFDLSRAE